LVSGTAECNGAVYEIIYTVEDDCGQTASCVQTFTLIVLPPTITCPPDEVVECFSDIVIGTPVAQTSCGLNGAVTTDGPNLVFGLAECNGAMYEVVYTMTDQCGQATSCTQTFTLTVPPPTIICPADETVTCFSDIMEGVVVTSTSCGFGEIVTTDGPNLVAGGDECDQSIYEIVYTVTDDCGLSCR